MSFMESPRFPERISVQASGGPGYSTDIITVRAGFESRNINWSQARARYDISHSPRTEAQKDELLAFFRMMRGAAYGFRFRDWSDYRVASTAGVLQPFLGTIDQGMLGTGDGVATYQLMRRYGSGTFAEARRIRKPVSGTVIVLRNGSPVTVGVANGNISIDTTTGVITFVNDQNRVINTHTVGASHALTLATAFAPNLAVGGRIWIEGVTGTAATVLNGRSHAVTGVGGATLRLAPQPLDSLPPEGRLDFFLSRQTPLRGLVNSMSRSALNPTRRAYKLSTALKMNCSTVGRPI